MKFDSEGAKKFGQITEANVGHRFAIVLDGVIQSAPSIRTAIYGGDAIITGHFGEQEARGLASVLENPLQTPVSIEEERSVSPTLGLDSIRASIIAGLLGLAITLVLVLIYYKFAGLIANLALIVNIILLMGALTMFNFVLTLPGIAGIILTIGLAVDASVLIYERLREELASGKSLKSRGPNRLRKSVLLDSRCQRHDLDHGRDPFLESERAGQRFRDFADARHSRLALHRAHRRAGISSAGSSIPDADQKRLDASPHLLAAHQLPRQRLPRLHVFARFARRRRDRVCRSAATAISASIFKGGDLLSLSAAPTVQVAQVRDQALKPLHLDNEPIQQSLRATQLHHHAPAAQYERESAAAQSARTSRMANSKSNAKNASARSSAASWPRTPSGRSASASSEF